jgi:hypothetical protein
MTTLLDSIASYLQGDTLAQLSRQVGADEDTTADAISMALPVLITGLARNADTPTGAESLERALDSDHDGNLLEHVAALFGGNAPAPVSPRTLNGAGILEHILGGRRAPVEQSIGRASGLNLQQAGKLLTLLAPLVMAWLGRRKREQGAGGLAPVLRTEQHEIERRAPGAGGLLNQIFGGHGSGVAESAAQMGLFPGLFGKRGSRPDFSDVRSGSSTASARRSPAGSGDQTYTVEPGDSLSKIAQRRYGAASKWRVIFEANRDKISDPDLIQPGQVLTIPGDADRGQ